MRGGPRPRLQRGDDLHLPLDGNGVPLRVRAPVLALAGGELVDPAAQRVAALRVAERAHRPAQALAVAETMLGRLSLLAIGEPGLSNHLAHGDFSGLPAFPPPVAQAGSRRVPQLRNRVGAAVAESDEGPDCQPALLCAVHAVLRAAYSWSRITTAVRIG